MSAGSRVAERGALACERCSGAWLVELVLPSGAVVRRCAGCRGLWAPRGGFAELVEVPVEHPMISWPRRVPRRTDRACPACGDTWLDSVRPSDATEVVVGHCAACGGIWIDGGALPLLKEAAARVPVRIPAATPVGPPTSLDFSDRFAFDTPLVNGVALPVAFAVALVAHAAPPLRMLFEVLVNMPLHELGHASAAWFSGHFAVPLPFYTSGGPDERSVLVAATLALFLAAAVLAGRQEKLRYLAWMGASGLLVQAAMTLVAPNWLTLRWITWAGCGGELVLGTLLVVSFHYRLPDRWRWDFARYGALLFGASAITQSFAFWRAVARREDVLRYGSAIGGGDNPNGDMNKLVGWGSTPEAIASTYLGLGAVCLVVVGAHYVIFLMRAISAHRAAAR